MKKIYMFLIITILIFKGIDPVSGQNSSENNYSYTDTLAQSEYERIPITINKFDEKKWKEITDKIEYKDYKEFETNSRSNKWNLNPTLVKIIVYSIFGLIVLFVLYQLINLSRKIPLGERIKNNGSEASSEELSDEVLMELNLEQLLEEALNEKKHRFAIRLYYLILLNTLNDKELIVWGKDKSNSYYLQKLVGLTHYQPFFFATKIFEQIWYGEREYLEQEYLTMFDFMRSFITQIKEIEVPIMEKQKIQ